MSLNIECVVTYYFGLGTNEIKLMVFYFLIVSFEEAEALLDYEALGCKLVGPYVNLALIRVYKFVYCCFTS